MDELVQKIVDQFGYPAGMVIRSAEARAQAEGTSVEAVLAAWSGGEAPPAAPAAADDAPPAVVPTEAPTPAPVAAPERPIVEVLGPADQETEEVGGDEADVEAEEHDEDPATPSAVPRWLAASFVILPLIAIMYALFSPSGPSCGEGAVLAIDPVTGEAVNCDGSAYGVDQVDYSDIGRSVYVANCAACHGAGGAGSALFPALTGGAVLTVFPQGDCQTHVDWVALATLGWPDATYGATAKPVGGSGGVMPSFGETLTDTELRSVVLYERAAFGGQPAAEAAVDCGLLTPEGEATAAG